MGNKRKDKIKGGLADKKKLKDFNPRSLKEGTKVEMEHTDDKSVAREIAMDHLVEDKSYYKKLRSIEKSSYMVETAADGKTQIVEGKEPLKKPTKKLQNKAVPESVKVNPKDPVLNHGSFAPKAIPESKQIAYAERVKRMMQKGDLQERWDLIKKDLDNSTAILDLEEQSKPDEAPEQESAESQDQQAEAQQDQQPIESEDASESKPEQQDEQTQGQDQGQVASEEAPEQQQMSPENADSEAEQKIIESMRQEGFSDAEIAYVVHGHMAPETSESDVADAQSKRMMAGIEADAARQSSDVDLEMKKRQMELEHQHAQRMKELEYNNAVVQSPDPDISKQMAALDLEERKLQLERAKKEMDMELEFKRKELELKLKHAEAAAAQKLEQRSLKDKNSGGSDEQD